MAGCFGFAVDVDRYVSVFASHFLDEVAQIHHGGVKVGARREFFIVDRQNESAGARLLLGKLTQVPVTGNAHDFITFAFNRICERTNTKTRCVLGTEILVDDDDGKTKFHAVLRASSGYKAFNSAEV